VGVDVFHALTFTAFQQTPESEPSSLHRAA
jgi:hypothetical protein